MKRSWLMIALGAALGLSVTFTSARADTGWSEDDYNAAEEVTLEARFEQATDGDSELRGTLSNTSGETAYDDLTLNIEFYDDQNTLIHTEDYKLDEDVAPGETEDFVISMEAPEGTAYTNYIVWTGEEDQ